MRTRRASWTSRAVAEPAERAAAFLIDAGIFWVVWVAGVIWLIETDELGVAPRPWAPRALVWGAVVQALWWAYDALSVAGWGSTVGRRILAIEVRDTAGALPDLAAALLRTCARTAGLVAVGAGLRSLWHPPDRQGFHDRVAGTVVVRSDALTPAGGGDGGRTDAAPPVDATEAAIRSGAPDDALAGWLRAVAEQTTVRLDVAAPSWRRDDDPAVTADRAFCLLLAALMARFPEQRDVLTAVIDAHVTVDDLGPRRTDDLRELVTDHDRARDWLGLPESANIALLLDTSARPRADDGHVAARARR